MTSVSFKQTKDKTYLNVLGQVIEATYKVGANNSYEFSFTSPVPIGGGVLYLSSATFKKSGNDWSADADMTLGKQDNFVLDTHVGLNSNKLNFTGSTPITINGIGAANLIVSLDVSLNGDNPAFSQAKFTTDLGPQIGIVGFSVNADQVGSIGDIANQISNEVFSEIGEIPGYIGAALKDGVNLLNYGTHFFNAADATNVVNKALDGLNQFGSSIANLVGINGSKAEKNKTITGNDADNSINGNGGSDVLFGNGGNDVIGGFQNNDIIDGGSGNDAIYAGSGNDVVNGGNDNDFIEGAEGSDTLYGGSGNDVIYGCGHLENGKTPYKRSTNDCDQIHGGSGNDALYGDIGNDTLYGDGGDDWLDGGSGKDVLKGGTGNDTYVFNGTNTIIENSNEGIDSVISACSYTLPDNVEKLILIDNANNSAISGWGNSLDNVLCGNNSNNAFYGRDGNDIEFGGKGNDSLIGGTGNDTLFGESGNDALDGGVGNDILNGGIGADSISTGVGRDVIKYENKTDSGVGSSNRDVITDFDANFDVIDLWQLSNKLTFIGTNAYSGKPGEIHYTSVMSTIVSIDFDGDKKSDFEIELMGYQTLSIDDFVFVQPK